MVMSDFTCNKSLKNVSFVACMKTELSVVLRVKNKTWMIWMKPSTLRFNSSEWIVHFLGLCSWIGLSDLIISAASILPNSLGLTMALRSIHTIKETCSFWYGILVALYRSRKPNMCYNLAVMCMCVVDGGREKLN